MPQVTLRILAMLKPDGTTPEWVYYSRVLTLDVVPVPGDVVIIQGPYGLELRSAGTGSTAWAPSDRGLQLSVTVQQRFFTPDGHPVLDAVLPVHLHRRDEDDENTSDQELWDRLDWGAILQTLDQAGYERQDGSLVTPPP